MKMKKIALALLLVLTLLLSSCVIVDTTPEDSVPPKDEGTSTEVTTDGASDGDGDDSKAPEIELDPNASRGLYFDSNGDGTCTLIGRGNCTDNDIIIPALSPEGDVVEVIGESAFKTQSDIYSVTMPDTIKRIEDGAFDGCLNLSRVTVSDKLEYFGDMVFSSCNMLETNSYDHINYIGSKQNPYLIMIEVENTKKGVYKTHDDTRFVANHAFGKCENIQNAYFGDKVVSIGASAFSGRVTLVNVNLPKNLKVIKNDTFSGCRLLELVRMPEAVTEIGNHAFAYCERLFEIELPDTLRSVGNGAFMFCSSLESVTIPEGVSEIGTDVFRNCLMLSSVKWPSSVVSVSESAFTGCMRLGEVVLPETLREIGKYAFENCTSLKSITIPKNVRLIGERAFGGCATLSSVTFENTEGWSCHEIASSPNGTPAILTDTAKNAENLSFSHSYHTLKRK